MKQVFHCKSHCHHCFVTSLHHYYHFYHCYHCYHYHCYRCYHYHHQVEEGVQQVLHCTTHTEQFHRSLTLRRQQSMHACNDLEDNDNDNNNSNENDDENDDEHDHFLHQDKQGGLCGGLGLQQWRDQ